MRGSARYDVPRKVLPRSEVADIAIMRLAVSTGIIHSAEKPHKRVTFDPEQYSAIQFDQIQSSSVVPSILGIPDRWYHVQ
eukprot:gene8921-biopygen3175